MKLNKCLIFPLTLVIYLLLEKNVRSQTSNFNNGVWVCNALGKINQLFEDERLNVVLAPGTPSHPLWVKIQKPYMEVYWTYRGMVTRYDPFQEKTLTTFSDSNVVHVASRKFSTTVWLFSSDLSLTETSFSTNVYRTDSSLQVKEGLLYQQIMLVRYQCRSIDHVGAK